MKNLSFLLFFLCSFVGLAQEKSNIESIVNSFINSTIEGDYDKLLLITYPKLFDFFPREQLKKTMNQTLVNEDFEISFNKIDPKIVVEDIKTIEGNRFTRIQYQNSLSMRFFNEIEMEPEAFLNILKSNFKEGKFSFDKKTNTFKIDTTSYLLGINDEITQGEWKFINIDGDQNIIKLLLDERIIKELEL
ncbi:MAG: hypothetical protein Q4G27_08720 [Flavobacteriaceae bacterium]|nr:hypothetical protein [Flavobacteriaceae bacterium]